MNKLLELSRSAYSVHIDVNEHKNYYMTAVQRLAELAELECPPDIEDDVRAKMIELDSIINVTFYPNTPVGSYDIYHYDLEMALDIALQLSEEEQ